MESTRAYIARTNADMQQRIADVRHSMDSGYALLRLSHSQLERSRHDLTALRRLSVRRDEWASMRHHPTEVPDTIE